MRFFKNKTFLSQRGPIFLSLSLAILTMIAIPRLTLASAAEESSHHEEEEGHEQLVHLGEAELAEFGVVVATAGPAEIAQFLLLPGEIQANANRVAHISPRFPGVVKKVQAHIGDKVRAGQTLAVIESDQSLSSYEMKTLISGTIIAKHLTLGETVTREQKAFIVADLSNVWVDITVYQKDLPNIAVGQKTVINGGHGLPAANGVIGYISPVVNETTRTALARVVLPNPEGIWRPGTFISASILVRSVPVKVAVPRTALQGLEGEDVIFVKVPEGFVPSVVTLGKKSPDLVEVRSGLQPGQIYVAEGGFTLKAELGKDSFGEGHSH